MRRRPAWLTAVLLLATVGPVRAGGPLPCSEPLQPGAWAPVLAPVDARYASSAGNGYANYLAQGGAPYEVTVDPWTTCHAFRVWPAVRKVADPADLQETTDGGRTWNPHPLVRSGFRAMHAYVPAPGVVYVAGGGNGAVWRRDPGHCRSWCRADGGIEDAYVYSLTFATPQVGYAVTLPCLPSPPPEYAATCDQHDTTGGGWVGHVAVWRTQDAGATWTTLGIPDPDTARNAFALDVDPADPDGAYVYDIRDSVVAAGQTAYVLRLAGDRFDQVATNIVTDGRTFRVFRHDGKLRWMAHDFGQGADVVWTDLRTSPQPIDNRYRTDATPLEPLPDGRLFALQAVPEGGGFQGLDARAAWTDDLGSSWWVENGRFPDWLPPSPDYVLERVQPGLGDVVYVTVSRRCHTTGTYQGDVTRCYPGDPPDYWHDEWRTFAYRMPPASGATKVLVPPGKPSAGLTSCTLSCALPVARSCSLPDAAAAGAGLVYDGHYLRYPVDATARYTVAFGAVDPATCADRGRIEVPLSETDLARAVALTRRTNEPYAGTPTLDATFADADTLAFDPGTGALYFSLRDNAPAALPSQQGDPASVWVWHGSGPARLVYVGRRCLRNSGDGSGMDLLAWDDAGSLVACADARPLPVSPAGTPRTPACVLFGPFRGYGYGWNVTSWTDAEGDRTLLYVDNGTGGDVVSYDLDSCAAERVYGADPIGAAKRSGEHTQLACVPGDTTQLWQRVGERASGYGLSGGPWCRTPTRLLVVTAPARTCAILLAQGIDAAVAGRSVRLLLDGVAVPLGPTNAKGTICHPGVARHDARATFAGDTRYRPSAGTWPPVRVPPPPRRPPLPVPPPPAPRAPAPAPEAPAPPLRPVLPAAAVPAPPAPPPAIGNVAGLTEEREENQQLAYVSEGVHHDDATEAAAELACAALVTAGAFAIAWRRRAAAAAAQVRR